MDDRVIHSSTELIGILDTATFRSCHTINEFIPSDTSRLNNSPPTPFPLRYLLFRFS